MSGMEGTNMEHPEQGANGNRRCYPVKFAAGHWEILGLPEGESPKNYLIHPATGEQQKEVGTDHVAEMRSPEVGREADDWDDQGEELI
jgi:hypothetical protein